MDDYFLRPAEEKDIERVLGIISTHDRQEEITARSFLEEYFDRLPDKKHGFHYVLESENEVVAVGGYTFDCEQGEYWVGLLYVDPYFRGQGLGNRLLERIISDVKALGSNRILVSVGEADLEDPALGFYTKMKFSNADSEMKAPLKPLQRRLTLVRSIVEDEVE